MTTPGAGSTSSRSDRRSLGGGLRPQRLALLVLAGLGLLAGLSGALVLVGILESAALPGASGTRLAAGHGLLMTLAFLGTLIGLERAVALGRPWGYAAPAAAGLGGLAILVGAPALASSLLFALGGAALVGIYIAFDRIERSLQTTIQGLGAAAWFGATGVLLAGRGTSVAVVWLAGFLVLTIAGERLDLARLRGMSGGARPTLAAVVALALGGAIVSLVAFDLGLRLAGLGLLGLAIWLGRFDVARRTVRLEGAPRFIATALLLGYGWLAAAGILWVVGGAASGLFRDALLHALFVGFVMSMVFAHAPIILPGVTGLPLPYRPWFVIHLWLLHLGLLVRVGLGDLAGSVPAWQAGGVLNVLAIVLFVVGSAVASLTELRRRRGSRARPLRRDPGSEGVGGPELSPPGQSPPCRRSPRSADRG